jgi:Rod binding domain-containing protein
VGPALAISPLSDIVLDVAKAADPLKYTAAVERLSNAAAPDAASASFEALLGSVDSDSDSDAGFEAAPDMNLADLRSRLAPSLASANPAGAAKAPYKQFEAFVLQTFIQSMMPKDASHVFGDGIAGSYWSSMLAEGMAKQIANSGGIGIASELAARHVAAPENPAGKGAPFAERWVKPLSGTTSTHES